MTDTCAPADQTVSGWHWLEYRGRLVPKFWCSSYWEDFIGLDRFPKNANRNGYRYVCPCPTPEQIAEREAEVTKLKAENQELRERLRPHDEKQFRDWGRIG